MNDPNAKFSFEEWQQQKYYIIQKQSSEVFCKKGVIISFAKRKLKHLCWSLFINNVAGTSSATLVKETQHTVFLWILQNF